MVWIGMRKSGCKRYRGEGRANVRERIYKPRCKREKLYIKIDKKHLARGRSGECNNGGESFIEGGDEEAIKGRGAEAEGNGVCWYRRIEEVGKVEGWNGVRPGTRRCKFVQV